MITLVLGHFTWMALGRGPSSRWQHLLNTVSAPPRMVSSQWEQWRAGRRERLALSNITRKVYSTR